MKYTIDNNS